jgi:hypothetical protein
VTATGFATTTRRAARRALPCAAPLGRAPAGCRTTSLDPSRRYRLRRPRASRSPRQPPGVLRGRRGATAERRTRAQAAARAARSGPP